MKRIAIVSSEKFCGKIEEDIWLLNEIKKTTAVELVSWDDSSINWERYNLIVLRSIWRYCEVYNTFLKWLSEIERLGIKVVNYLHIIKQNIDKELQYRNITKDGFKLIPTEIIYPDKMTDNEIFNVFCNVGEDIVIKPKISESGKNTFVSSTIGNKIKRKQYLPIEQIIKEIRTNKSFDEGVIIQPFIDTVDEGEISCVYILGKFSHAVLRYPGIFTEKKTFFQLEDIPIKIIKLTNEIIKQQYFKNNVYARIDIVNTENDVMIMEIELVDPDLYFRAIIDSKKRNEAIELLAEAIIKFFNNKNPEIY